jgi:hypothetical protein
MNRGQRRVKVVVKGAEPGARLSPECSLARAVLTQIIDDARCANPLYGRTQMRGTARLLDQMASVEALVDPEGGVAQWAGLLGLDPDFVRERLCRMAGISPH